jgi:lipopolysaccharide export LptBFGC system permease protein LptF
MSQNPNSRSNTPNFSPYYLINDKDIYFDSYNVFVEVQETGCGLLFATTQQPYVENYFVSFRDYVKDENAYSLLEEKNIIMNYGDVLLGIDGDDIGGKRLQDVKYSILCKTNNIIQLTFLNKHWFNNQVRKSVKTRDVKQIVE